MKKRGVSSVLATVLIILITIAAVTLVWQVVIPLIRGNTEGMTSCLDVASEVYVNQEYSVYNDTNVRVSIDMGDNRGIEALMIRITSDLGNSFTDKVEKGDMPSIGSRKSYSYEISDYWNETEDGSFGVIDKVGVASIVLKGAGEQICDYHEIEPLKEEDLEI